MSKGKCGGGKKLGISYNFKSEDAFLEYTRKVCAACWHCEVIYLKKDMVLLDGVLLDGSENSYLCQNCKDE